MQKGKKASTSSKVVFATQPRAKFDFGTEAETDVSQSQGMTQHISWASGSEVIQMGTRTFSQEHGKLQVFISGTQEDLVSERSVADEAIARLGMIPRRAETHWAESLSSHEVIRQAISECDIYLGIYGARYGWVIPDLGISATEFEYDEAQRLGKPTLVYLKATSCDEPRQQVFLKRIQDFDSGYFRRPRFHQVEQLSEWIHEDLPHLLAELLRNPDDVLRRQLALSYAGEVKQKFEYWRQRYVALPAVTHFDNAADETSSKGIESFGIPEIFRPRGFRVTYRTRGGSVIKRRRGSEKYADLRDAIAEVGDAVVIGEPGSGKTTSLWRLMLDYSDRATTDPSARLPVLVPLGGYDGKLSIREFIRAQLLRTTISKDNNKEVMLPAHRRLGDHLEDEISNGRMIVLFDGMNELPPDYYSSTIANLASFRRAFSGNRFIFTCRRADYTIALPLPTIQIEELDEKGIKSFIEAYLGSRANSLLLGLRNSHLPILGIGRNPYLLRMIVSIYEERATIPENRAELFNEFVGSLLRREFLVNPNIYKITKYMPQWNMRQQNTFLKALILLWPPLKEWVANEDSFGLDRLNEPEKFALLIMSGSAVLSFAQLAYRMGISNEHGTIVPYSFALGHIPNNLKINSLELSIQGAEMLYLGQSASILDQTSGGCRFTHQLIQEYFMAIHIATRYQTGRRVPESVFRTRSWTEALVLACGLASNPAGIVSDLIRTAKEYRELIVLARCVLEGKKVPIKTALAVVLALGEFLLSGYSPSAELGYDDDSERDIDESFEDEYIDNLIQDADFTNWETPWEDLYDDAQSDDVEYDDVQYWRRDQALEYIVAIGRNYPSLKVIEVIQSLLYRLATEDVALDEYGLDNVGKLTSILCSYSDDGARLALQAFRDPKVLPKAKFAMLDNMDKSKIEDFDAELVTLLVESDNDLIPNEILDRLIDNSSKRTIYLLASAYEHCKSSASRESIISALEYLCEVFSCSFSIGKSRKVQIKDK